MTTGNSSYSWAALSDILREPNIRDLIVAYNEELNPWPEVASINPDWETMLALEKHGVFKLWTARINGTLAGFIEFHIRPHLHYKDTLFALDSGWFISPAFRDNARLPLMMWRGAEKALRDMGVKIIVSHDNAMRPALPLFLHLGFQPRSTLFVKALLP